MKKNIMFIILGVVITLGIGVFAEATIGANTVNYGRTTVDRALDDLYERVVDINVSCLLISGVKETVGAKYACNPGDGIVRYFYILKTDTNDVEMIMDRNLTGGFTNWNTANDYFTSNNILESWTNVLSVDLPSVEDIANVVGNTNWITNDDWFYLDSNNGVYGQTQVANFSNKSTFAWIYDYTGDCSSYGCNYNASTNDGAYGYWAKETVNDKAYGIRHKGMVYAYPINDSTSYGIRPVITVSKLELAS